MKKGNIVIITGASSGLGKSIAKKLCEKGLIIYSVARNKQKLLDLKKECSEFSGEIRVVAGDLTDEKFREYLISNVIKTSGKIDYLINNAGFGKLTSFMKEKLDDIKLMYSLNVISIEHLIQLALPHMKKKNKGKIINIASVVAISPTVYFTTYGATKFALYGFSRILSYELSQSNISISVVFPSRMKTSFWEKAFQSKRKEEFVNKATGPDKIASYIIRNIDKKKFYFLPDLLSKISYYFLRHLYFINSFYMKHIMLKKTNKILEAKK